MTKRIEKAIDIFLDAINNGTLAKGTCVACAVGNLVRTGMGIEINLDSNYGDSETWRLGFCTSNGLQTRIKKSDFSSYQLKLYEKAIAATDFTEDELAAIEYAFETNTQITGCSYDNDGYSKKHVRADQIKGLEAVVKVMLEFDEQSEQVEDVFTKKAELIAI
jgi:hypothetical protein